MCSGDKLPTEVILQILIYLEKDRRSLGQCQLLCKAWHDPAQKQLYKTVALGSVVKTETFLRSMSIRGSHAPKLVRELVLNRIVCDSPRMELYFPRLFEICPNITELKAPPGQASSFWAKLLMEHAKGNVSHLREIPLMDLSNDDNIKSYGYVAYMLRSQLTTLTMCDWPCNQPSFKYDIAARQMNEFQRLKQLNVHLRGGRSIYEVFSFIQACPRLKSVDISMTDINRTLNDYIGEDERVAEWRRIKPEKSPSQIERLNVEYIPLTSKIIGYITNLFPNLKQLYFKSDNPNWEEDMELLHRVQIEGLRIPTDLWLSFLMHLYKHVPTFEVSNLFMAHIPDVLLQLIKQTDYGETMKIVYLERDTFYDFQPFVGIDHQSASKKYTRGFNFYNYRTIEVVYASEEDHYEVLPHLSLLEKVGYGLKGLEIQIHQADRFADHGTELYNMACGGFLNQLLKTCPLLETLCLKYSYLLNCEVDQMSMGSVKILRLTNCILCTSFFDNFISKRLPLLTHLVLHDCTLYDDNFGRDSSRFEFSPNMLLDTLRITGIRAARFHALYISVRGDQEEMNYRVDLDNKATNIEQDDFYEAELDPYQLKIIINGDVDNLVLEVNSFTIDVVLQYHRSTYVASDLKSSAYIDTVKEIQ